MPSVFLSPSLQEFNYYVGGGNEEYYMNLVADEMIPYLTASGITVVRSDIERNLRYAIDQSNAGNYGLHLALHSNAAPENLSGRLMGTDVYYYTTSTNGKRAAEIIANNFKEIYPYPDKVKAVPTTQLAELRQTRAPAVLIEVAYHDNYEDAMWIRNNIQTMARNISLSVADYFGVPFVDPY
ncbi:MAG: N-acetylmuramoyl-L-alanine amidase [Clostridia bacterium]|nr:N-acetylmuramoyl-L-alanine amidase [Clostridia bacterium]